MNDIPIKAGHYRVRLRRYGPPREVCGVTCRELVEVGPWLPVVIWQAVTTDPLTGETLDRSPVWWALANGHPIELGAVWPWCARHPITEARYREMLGELDAA